MSLGGLFGPTIGGFRWVTCATDRCQFRGDRVRVPLYRDILAPSVLTRPSVVCSGCWTVPTDLVPTSDEVAEARRFLRLDDTTPQQAT